LTDISGTWRKKVIGGRLRLRTLKARGSGTWYTITAISAGMPYGKESGFQSVVCRIN
jgi:hypothetical protein